MQKQRFHLCLVAITVLALCEISLAQQRGSFNFAKKTGGERDGDLTPSAIAGVSLGVVAGIGAMAVTGFFCYFVYRQQRQQEQSANSSFEIRKF